MTNEELQTEIKKVLPLHKEGLTVDEFKAYLNDKYGIVEDVEGASKAFSLLLSSFEILALRKPRPKTRKRVYIDPSFKNNYKPSELFKVLVNKSHPADILLYKLYYALTEGNDKDKESAIKAYKKYKGIS